MSNIKVIAEIADKQAKEITYRVQQKRALNQDTRTFAEVLQEELDKQKAIKNTGK